MTVFCNMLWLVTDAILMIFEMHVLVIQSKIEKLASDWPSAILMLYIMISIVVHLYEIKLTTIRR